MQDRREMSVGNLVLVVGIEDEAVKSCALGGDDENTVIAANRVLTDLLNTPSGQVMIIAATEWADSVARRSARRELLRFFGASDHGA